MNIRATAFKAAIMAMFALLSLFGAFVFIFVSMNVVVQLCAALLLSYASIWFTHKSDNLSRQLSELEHEQ